MKYLIASDLHGSAYYAEKLINTFINEKADKLILLGDIYYHGPRNPLTEEYNPKLVAEILNKITDKLIVIKGNCDSEVDTLISDFDFIQDMVLVVKNKSFFLTHGHIYNKDNLPKTKFDGIIYGHFHTGFLYRKNDMIIANTGSLSLPKNNTKNSYITITEEKITLKSLDNEIILEQNI